MTAGVDPRIAHTRAAVIDVVAELLSEAGFERLTVEAVAERSGVARSTIYRHWPERADLLIEGFQLLCGDALAPDTGALDSDLRAFGSELAQGLTGTTWGRALPSLVGAVAHDADLQRAQQEFSAARRRTLGDIFGRAIERGELPAGASVEDLAELFAAPFFARRLLWGGDIDENLVERQIRLVLGFQPTPTGE